MDDSFYAAIIALLAILIIWTRRSNSKLPYPPGPKGLPLIGNIRDVPALQEWITYAQWSRDFGMFKLLWVYLETDTYQTPSFRRDSSEPRGHTSASGQYT